MANPENGCSNEAKTAIGGRLVKHLVYCLAVQNADQLTAYLVNGVGVSK